MFEPRPEINMPILGISIVQRKITYRLEGRKGRGET